MAERDKRGHWLPGVSANPSGVTRTREEYRKAYHEALRNEYTPERRVALLVEAEQIAREQKSAKALTNISNEVRDTLDGKPVQRVENIESNAVDDMIDKVVAAVKAEEAENN